MTNAYSNHEYSFSQFFAVFFEVHWTQLKRDWTDYIERTTRTESTNWQLVF